VCFSGGKDSMLALDRAVRAGLRIDWLVTLYDAASERVRFHAVPVAVMRAQAEALGLPQRLYPTTPESFERVFLTALADVRAAGAHGVIFGNVHLADVRAWYEERVRAAGLAHVEPLWGEPPARLAHEVVARGYTAVLTCIETAKTDPTWLGQPLTEELITAFERRGIDPCGEYGEYHTLVTAGPLLRRPLALCYAPAPLGASEPPPFRQLDVRLRAPS
jgi:uncharacterized protein (TIGR00290 family)